MMDLGRVLGQGTLQGRQGQVLLQGAAQIPAADAPGEHVHDHRQVDELGLQVDIRNVSDPDLLRPYDVHVLHQVRVTWEGMLAIRGAARFRLCFRPNASA